MLNNAFKHSCRKPESLKQFGRKMGCLQQAPKHKGTSHFHTGGFLCPAQLSAGARDIDISVEPLSCLEWNIINAILQAFTMSTPDFVDEAPRRWGRLFFFFFYPADMKHSQEFRETVLGLK